VMPRLRVVILSITLAALGLCFASSTDTFRAGAASEYAHQSSDQVTVGAKAFDKPEQLADVFGKKADLLKHGVLPVLVVIENKRQKTLDLRSLEVTLVAADGRHVTAVDPGDVMSLGAQGKSGASQIPIPVPLPKKKNRLNIPEIADRAFVAKMLPAGESASGFYYFEARSEGGDRLYLSGMREMPSGHEIIYFEFPLTAEPQAAALFR
jgi:hypothetical protein